MDEILLIYLTVTLGALCIGLAVGYFVGQAMAHHRVSEYIDHNPFAPCYELGDDLFPEDMPEIIGVTDRERWKHKSAILRRHWGKLRNLN